LSLKTNIILLAGASAIMGAGLGGCGKLGPLEQPAPLYGQHAREDYEAKRAARGVQTENSTTVPAADQPDPNANDAPRTMRDLKDPGQQNVPASQAPVDGIPDPMGPRPSMSPPGMR